jgi:acetyl esterase
MSLHPQAVEFLKYAAESGQPKLYTLSPEEARAQVAGAGELIGPGPEVGFVDDVTIPTADGEIPARVYRPDQSGADQSGPDQSGPDESGGTIVWFHGGLWVFGGLDSHDAMCRVLANSAACTVVSVAYRLAPEYPFPVPLEDCWHAVNWVAGEFGGGPLVVGGDSAGGNLAAVCALRARDRGGPELALQVLVYPMTDGAMDTDSFVERGGDDTLLGKRDVEWSYRHYLTGKTDHEDSEVSPLRAPDLVNLPPAIVVTDEYDPLRDEGIAYARRLREAGVEVTAHHYEDMMHVFFQFVNVFERGNEAVEQVGHDIRAAIARTSAGTTVPQGAM